MMQSRGVVELDEVLFPKLITLVQNKS